MLPALAGDVHVRSRWSLLETVTHAVLRLVYSFARDFTLTSIAFIYIFSCIISTFAMMITCDFEIQ